MENILAMERGLWFVLERHALEGALKGLNRQSHIHGLARKQTSRFERLG